MQQDGEVQQADINSAGFTRIKLPIECSQARRKTGRWNSAPRNTECRKACGCAKRLMRTPKENLLWVRDFDTVEELRVALLEFRKCYNET